LTLREQHLLTQSARRGGQAVRIFTPAASVPEALKNLRLNSATNTSATRLRLLQIFLEIFDWDTGQNTLEAAPWMDGRGRLRQIMNQMVAAEFAELSISELAPMVPCSPRHLNRLFREELGASFREKQIELRLAKACILLSTSDAKVVDVALESGYQSSSVFSGLFKKHLGISPGQWRRQGLKLGTASRAS
jgi:AraC-like DNA-binding protein